MDLFFTLNLIYWDFEEVSTQSMVTIADRYESSKLEILRVYLAATLRNCRRSSWNLFFSDVTSNHQILLQKTIICLIFVQCQMMKKVYPTPLKLFSLGPSIQTNLLWASQYHFQLDSKLQRDEFLSVKEISNMF